MSMICPKCQRGYEDDQAFCEVDGQALATRVDPLIGRVIDDRYRIERQLGEGGMGRVYLAQHMRIPKKFAVKFLNEKLAHDAQAVRRLKEEADRVAQIADDHVASVIDSGQTPDGLVYLVMEYVEGQTLDKLIDDNGPLPPKRVAEITAQIAAALSVAHSKRIIHRDLKPENVMIGSTFDNRDRVKVLDFGIAKVKAEDVAQSTKTGQVIGTPDFMSPEQLERPGDVDERSDIYSVGLVAFRMLTGKFAFPGEMPFERMAKRLSTPPRTLVETKPGIEHSAALQRVLDRALARTVGQRYASATEFSRDFLRAANGGRTPHTRLIRMATAVAAFGVMALSGNAIYNKILSPRDTTHPQGSSRDSLRRVDSLRRAAVERRDSLRRLDSIRIADGIRVANRIRLDSIRIADSIRLAENIRVAENGDAVLLRRRLARASALLAPGAATTTVAAREALSIAKEALPKATTVSDSVEAQYDEIEAYLALTAVEPQVATKACAILKRIKEPARKTQFATRVERLSHTILAADCSH